jgi:hypothetical protein
LHIKGYGYNYTALDIALALEVKSPIIYLLLKYHMKQLFFDLNFNKLAQLLCITDARETYVLPSILLLCEIWQKLPSDQLVLAEKYFGELEHYINKLKKLDRLKTPEILDSAINNKLPIDIVNIVSAYSSDFHGVKLMFNPVNSKTIDGLIALEEKNLQCVKIDKNKWS